MSSKPEQLFRICNRYMLMYAQISAIVEMDVRKLRHDPYELFTRMIQPAIWLLIFGQAMAKTHAIPTGSLSYLDYIAPGILVKIIFFF